MGKLEEAHLHPEVRLALELAGWAPGRHYDVSPWISTLEGEGYVLFDEAIEALTQLGGLRVSPRPSPSAVFGTGQILFDPLWAAQGERPRIAVRELSINSRLCPLGEWIEDYILLIASNGDIVAETSFQMLKVASSLPDALEVMILAESRPESRDD
ncbi:SUKH-3 domain-containing protein [Streptosporangium soli]|nr:SUKH-3 domain-containing protein [Streptosporangium sp. KLBMP 9127]